MKCIFYFLLFTLLFITNASANYSTPGTGIKWNLDDLVINSGGVVTFSSGEYLISDTLIISTNDTLYIYDDVIVKYAPATFLSVFGTLLIDPPTGVLFTAADTALSYFGVRIDSSVTTVVRKLTFEYATSFRLNDCSIIIDSCIFRYNNKPTSTTFGNGAVSLFRAKPVITNSLFTLNRRAAIQGGANIANAPKIIGNTFIGNNLLNQNVPQINLGATGSDTVYILNNKILMASTNSGGIGFLPIGNANTVITGNVIKNNRYGITLNGGSNINALISYNEIDSNNTQNNPALGGSGIAFSGGSSTSQQNSIVTGNFIRWNLWGVTIQGRSRPNLGKFANSDTTDDGKNYFLGNTNSSTPLIDLYNNSIDTIYAQGNYWGTEDTAVVEERIFHFPDNNALGPVIFLPIIVPVELNSFSAETVSNGVILRWQTATELNNRGFEIERKLWDADEWKNLAFVNGSGTISERIDYSYFDSDILPGSYNYRIKQIDFNGSYTYYNLPETIEFGVPVSFNLSQNYPNPFNPATTITFSVPKEVHVNLSIFNVLGEKVMELKNEIMLPGVYQASLNATKFSSGVYLYTITAGEFMQTKKMVLLR